MRDWYRGPPPLEPIQYVLVQTERDGLLGNGEYHLRIVPGIGRQVSEFGRRRPFDVSFRHSPHPGKVSPPRDGLLGLRSDFGDPDHSTDSEAPARARQRPWGGEPLGAPLGGEGGVPRGGQKQRRELHREPTNRCVLVSRR